MMMVRVQSGTDEPIAENSVSEKSFVHLFPSYRTYKATQNFERKQFRALARELFSRSTFSNHPTPAYWYYDRPLDKHCTKYQPSHQALLLVYRVI